MASVTRPKGQSPRWAPSSLTRTTSPIVRFHCGQFPLLLDWSDCKYSPLQRTQNWSARYCTHLQRRREYKSEGTKTPGGEASGRVFIVRSMAGERGCGSSASDGMVVRGRALTIAVTSVMRVTRSSCVSWDLPSSRNMTSNTRRTVPICRSHTPPKCEA